MKKSSILIGKFVRRVARLKGGGSALPGLVVEKIDRNFLRDTLNSLPEGVVVVSGTNGKTTTTKIIVELLRSQGLKVFTNSSGSNFVRGVIAAILENINPSGRFDFDIAVLELDEAHAVRFVKVVKPKYALLLNVMRDQLDRFGEIDTTAKLLAQIAEATTGKVIINREDRRLSKIKSKAAVKYFGLSHRLLGEFPEDDEMFSEHHFPVSGKSPKAEVVFADFKRDTAVYEIGGERFEASLKLDGIYNFYNAAGALLMAHEILPKSSVGDLMKALSKVESAFGRGEIITSHGEKVQLLLVKNPSGFQLSLKSFGKRNYKTMIAINDQYADGRDMSWLWNVDFRILKNVDVVSGVRAYDMALRLKYDEVHFDKIEEDLAAATEKFMRLKGKKQIFCTYTAMLEIRKILNGRSLE
ncbi:MAG: MurT ligase domain-containing protein [Candidatus Nomurabacteria bacterium]|nr:MurT ligase domain-containing protein [Candidatus Nomurabacteria bacterium]